MWSVSGKLANASDRALLNFFIGNPLYSSDNVETVIGIMEIQMKLKVLASSRIQSTP